jgi:superfamily II DNA or RNA helicase
MSHPPLRLRDFEWEVGYSTDECDLIRSFYEPAMSTATRYDRAVGYFSSSALALISKGIKNLYLHNGSMRLIASPVLSSEDQEAIRVGYQKREELIEKRLLEYLDPGRLSIEANYRLQLLTGMIADGLLEVRIAVKEEENGALNLYHEKVGVFIDGAEDYITFIGSPNESWNGWVGNAESFALHKSWDLSAENAKWERELFNRTWHRRREKIPVYDFPDAIRKALFDKFPPRNPGFSGIRERPSHYHTRRAPHLTMPVWLEEGKKLYDFQKEAVNRWLDANGRGVFAMATGTGKTVTALVAAMQLAKEHVSKRLPLLALVAVPSKDLVKQWQENAQEFGFSPVCCHSDTSSVWPNYAKVLLDGLQASSNDESVEMLIATAGTLATPRFQETLNRFKGSILFIGDEMHSFGTNRRLRALPDAQYRIGLSATPRRHGDEEGTSELMAYFGDVLQRIDIKKAIELKALVPYSYEPVMVPLDATEMEQYRILSAKIAAILGASPDYDDFIERAGRLLIERVRLLGHAQAKLSALESIAVQTSKQNHNLVYVAEDTHPIYGTRQLDEVVRLLGEKLGMRVNIYTSDTPADKRITYQRMLRDGSLQALIAMRCLDEGIDIPEAQRGIILASSQNPRQFVQRRGRILRRDDKGGKTHAELYDFLVVPDKTPPIQDPTFRLERRLVGRELSRSLELSSASENWRDSPPDVLVQVMKRYDLLELLADYNNPTQWDAGGENVYD